MVERWEADHKVGQSSSKSNVGVRGYEYSTRVIIVVLGVMMEMSLMTFWSRKQSLSSALVQVGNTRCGAGPLADVILEKGEEREVMGRTPMRLRGRRRGSFRIVEGYTGGEGSVPFLVRDHASNLFGFVTLAGWTAFTLFELPGFWDNRLCHPDSWVPDAHPLRLFQHHLVFPFRLCSLDHL